MNSASEAHSGFYKGVYIKYQGERLVEHLRFNRDSTWTPYRIHLIGEKPRFFSNLNEAKAFISWWLDDV